jgi:hypothetical protein
MDRHNASPRLEILASAEALEFQTTRLRLTDFNSSTYHDTETPATLLEPRLLLELVSHFPPADSIRLVYTRAHRAWRFDVEARRRLAGSDEVAAASLVSLLAVVAPQARFKTSPALSEGPATTKVARLAPCPSTLATEESAHIWLPPPPFCRPDFGRTLDAARTYDVTEVSFRIRPFVLSPVDRSLLDTARFRLLAKSIETSLEHAQLEAVHLWLATGRGCTFDVEYVSRHTLLHESLDALSASLFGRSQRIAIDQPVLDLRLATPASTLPVFRFWPTPSDLSGFRATTPREVRDAPGTVTVGLDAADEVVRLSSSDRFSHCAVWGGSGAGKTSWMSHCIMEDIAKGEGVFVVDVHGDLSQQILASLPAHRRKDLIWVDAGDEALQWRLDVLTTPGLSPLLERAKLTNMFISFFRQQYAAIPESMGPAFEQYFSNAFKLLLSAPDSEDRTITKFDDVLLDETFRRRLLETCDDPKVRQFWEGAERVSSDNSLANITPYILNKMSQISSNPLTAAVISGNKPPLNLRTAMDTRKVVVVRLPKGVIGEYDARFLGALFLMALTDAAMSRSRVPEEERVPFRVYCDEFADLASASASRLLSECRKYKLSLTLANQSLSQLSGDKFNPVSVGQAMLANCGTFILFRLGVSDAMVMSSMIDGASAQELTQLGVGEMIVRRLVNGAPCGAERLRSFPPGLC